MPPAQDAFNQPAAAVVPLSPLHSMGTPACTASCSAHSHDPCNLVQTSRLSAHCLRPQTLLPVGISRQGGCALALSGGVETTLHVQPIAATTTQLLPNALFFGLVPKPDWGLLVLALLDKLHRPRSDLPWLVATSQSASHTARQAAPSSTHPSGFSTRFFADYCQDVHSCTHQY